MLILPKQQATFEVVDQLSTTNRSGGFGSTDQINAIKTNKGLRFEGKLSSGTANFLIDSGADEDFITAKKAQELGLRLTSLDQPYTVYMANGDEYKVNKVAKGVPFEIQGFKDKIDLHVVPITNDKVILGTTFLSKYNPKIDWKKMTIQIERNGQISTLQVDTEQDEEEFPTLQFIGVEPITKIWEAVAISDKRIFSVEIPPEETNSEEQYFGKDRQQDIPKEMEAILKEFDDLFQDPPAGPIQRPHNPVYHTIRLKEGAKPIKSIQYRLRPDEQQEIYETVEELSKNGHIEPCVSEWSSAVHQVPKKVGKRMVVDYRGLNKSSEVDPYPLPNPNELLQRAAAEAEYLTALDLKSGFFQLPMHPDSKKYTAFTIPGPQGGQYQYTVMPFGLHTAPTAFQRFMNEVLRGLIVNCIADRTRGPRGIPASPSAAWRTEPIIEAAMSSFLASDHACRRFASE